VECLTGLIKGQTSPTHRKVKSFYPTQPASDISGPCFLFSIPIPILFHMVDFVSFYSIPVILKRFVFSFSFSSSFLGCLNLSSTSSSSSSNNKINECNLLVPHRYTLEGVYDTLPESEVKLSNNDLYNEPDR